MTSPRKWIAPALVGAAAAIASVGVAPTAQATRADPCLHNHTATVAESICHGMPAGYYQRVRGHYVTGIFSGGYVYGPWYGNGVVSIAYHSGINSEIVQLCAGGGCGFRPA